MSVLRHRRPFAPPHGRGLVLVMLALLAAGPVAADTITLAGSTIPLRGCRIIGLASGELFYEDPSGRRQRRPLEDVRAVGFDGLVPLDEAEAALAAGDLGAGLHRLLEAVLAAPSDLHRQWIHMRLSRIHDRRGEFVEAARHAAAVWLIDDDPYWRVLEPLSKPDDKLGGKRDEGPAPSMAAAAEARAVLREADRRVDDSSLSRIVDRLLESVGDIHDRLARDYSGPALNPDETMSGLSRQHILAGGLRAQPEGAAPETPAPRTPAPRTPDRGRHHQPEPGPGAPDEAPQPPAVPEASTGGGAGVSPSRIDGLLEGARFVEAVALCEAVARDVTGRDLDRFLYQYGAALRGAGRPDDAAVMHMRGAILFPDSPFAPASLIETAMIYRQRHGQPETARRLLELARQRAEALGKAALVERARRELERLDE